MSITGRWWSGLVRLWGWERRMRTELYVLVLAFQRAACSIKHDEEQRTPLLLLLITRYWFRSATHRAVYRVADFHMAQLTHFCSAHLLSPPNYVYEVLNPVALHYIVSYVSSLQSPLTSSLLFPPLICRNAPSHLRSKYRTAFAYALFYYPLILVTRINDDN